MAGPTEYHPHNRRPRALVYGDVDLNLLDGSAIWLQSVSQALAAAGCAVTVVLDGARREYTLEKDKENILDAALKQGIELPYSCKGGVCSTCRAKLIEGSVDMDVNFALEDYELARGFILCCQSYPVTDRVVVDFDQSA